ncbi:MAG: hypothetical protein BWK80_21945 [Desulfobacteraceae bacterium IS3]|nr:MAG: hypothetical protein BWK80_21945 [Desulfobacteraceae bacterium IS3]
MRCEFFMGIVILILIIIVLSLIVGFLGMNRKFGFWGYFFGSILLTPVIGLLLVLASDKRKPVKPAV